MNSAPILKEKHAVVFGAGGTIDAAVAKEFAAEGAEVFLSSRTKANVEAVAQQIAANGGKAHASVIDTSDDAAVSVYLDGIVKQTHKIDIMLDFAGPLAREYGNGKMAVDQTKVHKVPELKDGQWIQVPRYDWKDLGDSHVVP